MTVVVALMPGAAVSVVVEPSAAAERPVGAVEVRTVEGELDARGAVVAADARAGDVEDLHLDCRGDRPPSQRVHGRLAREGEFVGDAGREELERLREEVGDARVVVDAR